MDDPAIDVPSFRTQSDMLADHAARQPTHVAVQVGEDRIDYQGLNALADRVAAALQRDGLLPTETLAVCASSSIAYMGVFLGGLRAGVAVAPLAPSSTPAQLVDMVADAGARHFFIDSGVAQALAAGGVSLPPQLQCIALDDAADIGVPFSAWLAPVDSCPTPVEIDPTWPFNIIYSSGTTGTPKGIVQSHAMRWGHVARAATFGYDSAASTLIATPLYSNTSLVAVFPTLAGGGRLVLMTKFDVAGYLAIAERERISHTMLVPVQYQRLMACPEFDRFDLSAFRFKSCTSAPFQAALKADILARWPGALLEFYGMTEGGGTCILAAHEFPHKLHTVGRPAEGHDIRLIDDHGRVVAPGVAGEVVGRSGAMMSGYHHQPEKTAESVWFDEQGQRFQRTGDIGVFDADGFLTLMDRKKDMIISGGFNIYPSDLEAVLCQHPAVADAAVVGVPSAAWGETPVAFVVRRADSRDSAATIREAVNAGLGKTQRLADLRLTDELPRSAIGKVLKRELRDRYAANCAADHAASQTRAPPYV